MSDISNKNIESNSVNPQELKQNQDQRNQLIEQSTELGSTFYYLYKKIKL